MESKGVDIIIPIYNAYEEMVQCIDSIKKWTDLKMHRLILINDCSTDSRILPYAESIKENNCIVVHNKENKGFAANINMGMQQSQSRDVILLNSDTVVTKGWVDKLLDCAYSDPQTASVTPLSNNAMICSVPVYQQENKLPDGYTVDTYAELIERISLRKYPGIPVANGFCMFIKREVLDLIGGFDANTFGKGYGEENDFCFRAVEAGYHHVMCDDTFILHTGTRSFTDGEKEKNSKEHEKILTNRYPELVHNVQVFLRDYPPYQVQCNIQMWMTLDQCKTRKTILYLLHADFREDAQNYLGGTQLHVKDLVEGLRGRFNMIVAARNLNYLNLTFYTDSQEIFFQFDIGQKAQFETLRSQSFAKLYGRILDAFKVDCVHIHHVMGVSLELFYEADKRSIPIFTTQHDFYCLCPNITLLDENNHFCIEDENHDCRRCLKHRQGIADSIDYIPIWKRKHHEALRMSKKIFVPSHSAEQIIKQNYPDLADKLTVIGHGLGRAAQNHCNGKDAPLKKQAFHAAFLGAISQAKGLNMVIELVRKSSEIQWYLFGYFGMQMHDLDRKKNFHNIGAYHREDLPELMKKHEIDLVCIFSICPETFCYTLSEAVTAGVPVLAFDIGALGERVRQMDNGWLMPYQSDRDEVLEKIISIQKDSADYERKKQNTKNVQMKTIAQMCSEYAGIYQDFFLEEDTYQRGQIDYSWLLEGSLGLEENSMEF